EAQQKQITELLSLERGHQVPVSPRDNHEIHMQVHMGEQNEGGQWAGGAIDALVQEGNPEAVEAAMLHWSQHVEFLKAQGRLGGAENGAKSFAKQMRQAMEMLTAPPPQMGDPSMQMGDPAMNGQMQEA